MTKTRKTIGVMVGGITDDFTRFLCKGLREAAKEQDVNMVVLPGKLTKIPIVKQHSIH